jgi:hypothetical protein
VLYNLKLGIIGFRLTPNWFAIRSGSAERPYLKDFIEIL